MDLKEVKRGLRVSWERKTGESDQGTVQKKVESASGTWVVVKNDAGQEYRTRASQLTPA